MEKTVNYNLNKPEAGDPLRLADFNENAEIIDAALGTLDAAIGALDKEHVVVGSFEGTGTNDRFLDLGFTPEVVFFATQKSSAGDISISIATKIIGFYIGATTQGFQSSRVVDGGVHLMYSVNNSTTYTNYYIAFR